MAAGNRKKKPKSPRLKRCRTSDKVMYPTEEKAMSEARFRSALHGSEGGKTPKRAYVCDSCRKWHLTAIENWKG